MTNAADYLVRKQACGAGCFGLRHSTFLRHSDFVIRHSHSLASAGPPSASDEFRRAFFRRSPAATENGPTADASARRTAKMARLEAVLFVAEGALSTRRLVQLATLADVAEARTLVEQLNAAYDAGGSAFRIERVATGWQMLTRPVFAAWLSRIHQRQSELKLSPPAMETLTIVAYRQPVTRADIESIRGVQCAEILKQLMDRSLVRIGGEDNSLGRPYLYETTRSFLELFGLRSLDDLPMRDELRRKGDGRQGPGGHATAVAEDPAHSA